MFVFKFFVHVLNGNCWLFLQFSVTDVIVGFHRANVFFFIYSRNAKRKRKLDKGSTKIKALCPFWRHRNRRNFWKNIEANFKSWACEQGAQMSPNHENTGGRKSCGTLPLKQTEFFKILIEISLCHCLNNSCGIYEKVKCFL